MFKQAVTRFTLLGAALGFAAPCVQADIYKFTDANGVAHFHNIPNYGDSRYKLYMHEGKLRPNVKLGKMGLANTANRKRFTPIIATVAQRYKVDEHLLHAVIMTESGYNPSAISPKGAVGLMQLMPDTAKRYGVTNISDPTQNINGGTRYLSYLLKLFNNNLHLALAAYNAGENAVIGYGRKIPPYQETVNYVAKVLAFYQGAKLKDARTRVTYTPVAQ